MTKIKIMIAVQYVIKQGGSIFICKSCKLQEICRKFNTGTGKKCLDIPNLNVGDFTIIGGVRYV